MILIHYPKPDSFDVNDPRNKEFRKETYLALEKLSGGSFGSKGEKFHFRRGKGSFRGGVKLRDQAFGGDKGVWKGERQLY